MDIEPVYPSRATRKRKACKYISTNILMEIDSNPDGGVTVLLSSELEPLEDLDESLANFGSLLKSNEWLDQYEATTLVRKLVLFHLDKTELLIYENLSDIFELIKISVDSLRSAQSRNALFCICDIFRSLGNKELLVVDIDSLLNSLVIKGTNEKRFIAQAGEEAIENIVTAAPSAQVLHALLEFSNSKSTKICALVAKYSLVCLNGIAGQHKLKALVGNDEILISLIKGFLELESGRSVQARKPAQAGLKLLASAMEQKQFDIIVKREFNPAEVSRIFAVVKQGSKPKEARSSSLREMMAKQRETLALENTNRSGKK